MQDQRRYVLIKSLDNPDAARMFEIMARAMARIAVAKQRAAGVAA